ncbi:heterogeneous nuclear ribonucleoprotein Q-like isoform X2 [Lotus japonicus]|uniref:heterogeneous nuclear ribonucleoprotein Q-like isoform X2 n=1 Tax=Lotus japonicus TaxID=34305 RepID=UPI002588E21C|nr:heterogeneous nuclear ribonucleoprotein Q-like isoform X2 [Lotus japonicus]
MITEGNISRPRATPLSYMEAAMEFTQLLPISTKLPLLLQAVEGVGPGVESIELIKDPQNPSKNRGFAFVLYYNNACADYSRQKMPSSSFNLCGNTPTVRWADPKNSPDHSASSQD